VGEAVLFGEGPITTRTSGRESTMGEKDVERNPAEPQSRPKVPTGREGRGGSNPLVLTTSSLRRQKKKLEKTNPRRLVFSTFFSSS